MIIFHEGLPRSGKSYEAVVHHMIPALQAGREVFARIDGLNHEKIAECAEIPVELCRELLHHIDEEQVATIYEHVRDNSLVMIDEIQDYWPNGRKPLTREMSEFVTRHGHRGLDILVMGQDMRDVHAIWRRRVAQKSVYTKLDGLGFENHYSVRVFKASTAEKFEEVSNERGKYDPKYFGTYASHVSTDTNTGNYKDKRAVIWNNKGFRYGAPLLLVMVVFAVFQLFSFFGSDSVLIPEEAKPLPSVRMDLDHGAVVVGSVVAPAPVSPPPPVRQPDDFVSTLVSSYRPRLAAFMAMKDQVTGLIEFYESDRVVERLTFEAINELGWTVTRKAYGVDIERNGRTVNVTQWPLQEQQYRVSENKREEVRQLGAAGI